MNLWLRAQWEIIMFFKSTNKTHFAVYLKYLKISLGRILQIDTSISVMTSFPIKDGRNSKYGFLAHSKSLETYFRRGLSEMFSFNQLPSLKVLLLSKRKCAPKLELRKSKQAESCWQQSIFPRWWILKRFLVPFSWELWSERIGSFETQESIKESEPFKKNFCQAKKFFVEIQ